MMMGLLGLVLLFAAIGLAIVIAPRPNLTDEEDAW